MRVDIHKGTLVPTVILWFNLTLLDLRGGGVIISYLGNSLQLCLNSECGEAHPGGYSAHLEVIHFPIS